MKKKKLEDPYIDFLSTIQKTPFTIAELKKIILIFFLQLGKRMKTMQVF